MDRLRRALAPVSDEAWEQIDQEAAQTLRHFLAARPLVDFSGPKGWAYSAQSRGRVEESPSPFPGVEARTRLVTPVVELRTSFELDRSEIDAVDRGSDNPDLDPVTDAAKVAASAENRTVFDAIAAASPHEAVAISDDYGEYPSFVAKAVARLLRAGVEGPYAVGLGDRCYTGVVETTEHGGYPVLEHIRLILGGPVVWASDIDGALVVSTRGGDYELFCGSDFSVGYISHTDSTVRLYIEESVAFQVHEPNAAVALRYPEARPKRR